MERVRSNSADTPGSTHTSTAAHAEVHIAAVWLHIAAADQTAACRSTDRVGDTTISGRCDDTPTFGGRASHGSPELVTIAKRMQGMGEGGSTTLTFALSSNLFLADADLTLGNCGLHMPGLRAEMDEQSATSVSSASGNLQISLIISFPRAGGAPHAPLLQRVNLQYMTVFLYTQYSGGPDSDPCPCTRVAAALTV